MDQQSALIKTFYESFSRRDSEGMNACYASDIVFSDPVFGMLEGERARAMWRMLCAQASDFSLTYGPIEILDHEYATCEWVVRYRFSKTGRRVTNRIKAHMRIVDGQITEHSDAFRLSTWIGQALGWKGQLFGWTGVMKRAVQKKALQGLEKFMEKEKLERG